MNKSSFKKHNALKNDLTKLIHLLSLTAHDAGGQAKLMLSESLDNVRDKSTDLQNTVIDYVQDKPIKALGIATLLGFMFGLTMRKKKRYYNNTQR